MQASFYRTDNLRTIISRRSVDDRRRVGYRPVGDIFMPNPQELIDRHVAEVRPLRREAASAFWRASLTGSETDYRKSAELELAIRRVLARRDEFRAIQRALEIDGLNGSVKRQLLLMRNAYAPNQLEASVLEDLSRRESDIERTFNTFRAEFDGERVSDNTLKQVLKESSDAERCRTAWEASKQVGAAVAQPLLELVRLRNQTARSLGYPDYYQMGLQLQELSLDKLSDCVRWVNGAIDHAYANFKCDLDRRFGDRFGMSASALRPWHYGDPFFQEVPKTETVDFDAIFRGRDIVALASAFYSNIGLPIDSILERSDLYEREGKCQHAFCIGIDLPSDVRILCNLDSNTRWMETLLHEFGHAIHDTYINLELPWLLREPAHVLTTEALAMLLERLVLDEDWLREFGELEPLDAQRKAAEARLHSRHQQLVSARWFTVMVRFERALYADPGQDLNGLWWQIVQQTQGLTPPENRDAPDWASKIHLVTEPVYYQNYFLGGLCASQLFYHLKKRVGDAIPVCSTETGDFFLDTLFASGARHDWQETLRRATGEELNPRYWVDEFVT